jgi:hypothetical protein
MINEMRSALEIWLEDINPFPRTIIDWDHYDPNVRIVFLRVEGEWTLEIRKEIIAFLREHKKKVLIGRLITGE